MAAGSQVFFDPSGKRACVASAIGRTALLALFVILAGLLAAILSTSVLPQAGLPLPGKRALPASQPRSSGAVSVPFAARRDRKPSLLTASRVKRFAFYVNWDDRSFTSLQQNASRLDALIAEWLQISGPSGTIRHNNIGREREMRAWLAAKAPGLEVLPLIGNYDSDAGRWDGQSAAELLSSGAARERLIEGLLAFVRREKLPGVVVDFERLPPAGVRNLTIFVRELAARFFPLGLRVLTAVPPADIDYDYEELARASSQIVLMAYDEHNDASAPGPVASQAWFEAALDGRIGSFDRSKLIVGIGSYGYDWEKGGAVNIVAAQEAWDLLDETGAALSFDAGSLNPSLAWADAKTGVHHEVSFLDAVTFFNQAAAAMATAPYGIALWRLGLEDRGVWQILGKGRLPSASSANELENLRPGYDLTWRGEGEVLQVTGVERTGSRLVDYRADGNLIAKESVARFPKRAAIARWGASSEKVVALTFDDGPDPATTPAILDILAAKGVRGAFFVVGSNATARPDILRRIYAEGHDVGNHTYTHPDLAAIRQSEVRFELDAAQRTIEAALGIHTLLFRPPYTGDIAPETAAHMKPLGTATRLGYLTVSSGIDPFDWTLASAGEIVQRAITQIGEGRGHIVLLHDAGGNRSHTVAALPKLIDALRAEGYRLVTVHELLHAPREQLMPPAGKGPGALASRAGFGLIRGFGNALAALLHLGIALGAVRLLLVIVLAVWHKRQEGHRTPLGWMPPSLAVILPAFNEEKVICAAVRSLLASTVSGFDIIVVDDGSTDGTARSVREEFAGCERVELWQRPNGGKAAALNHALETISHEVVILADADTIFEPDAVPNLVRHFQDGNVAAVAGAVKVSNRVNWISRFQALEYVTCQNLERRAQEILRAIFVVPGCFGAWRREPLLAVGGISPATFAEDADATIKLQRVGWRVLYEADAVARTEVPQSVGQFLNQRIRWMYGCLQTSWLHRSALRRLDAKGIALFTLPNILIYQVFFVLVSPVADLALVWSVFTSSRSYLMHPADRVPEGLYLAVCFWLSFQLVEMGAAVLAFALEPSKDHWWRLLPLAFLQRFWYRQLLYWVALVTLARIAKGRFYNWDKLHRYGTGRLQSQPALRPGDRPLRAAVRSRARSP